MKNIILGFALVLILSTTSCVTRINPTEVGFKIDNSGDYRGIDSLPLMTGWQFFTPGFSYVVTMPTTQQHVIWSEDESEGSKPGEHITVACLGGAGFKIDVGLNYRINPSKASKIYLKYKTDDLESITQTYLRNVVRGSMQDVSGYITVDSILNNLPGFEAAVKSNVTNRFEKDGFIVDNFSILKQPTPTDAQLAASINAKIKAKQDAETTKMQLQQSIAQANKDIAKAKGDSAVSVIRAQGEAEAVKKIQQVLSPTYVQYILATRWNGVQPTVVGGGSGMILQLKQ
jgi:regulator of protease activity HflC (stomatin/prohibitin superfamily)